MLYRISCGVMLVLALGACGGEGGDGEATGVSGSRVLTITQFELAQTHVLPATGKSWTLRDGSGAVSAQESLHFTGKRAALALVGLSPSGVTTPRLEAWSGGALLGSVALDPPAMLPPTEDGGAAYATNRYSATVPAAWMNPGVQLRAASASHDPSSFVAPEVGADFAMTVRVLPFYLFGANDVNSPPLSATAAPAAPVIAEVLAKWPVSTLDVVNHPAQRANWPTLVVGPRDSSAGTPQPAYVADDSGDYRDGFAALATLHSVVRGLLVANGEAPQAVQYYAPVLALNAAGAYTSAGGGIGGSSVGTGDDAYAGVFIHEQGHAFGMPHAGSAFDNFDYPYEWGSLKGSAWGWDANLREFLAPFVPSSASRFAGCAANTFGGHARAMDTLGRCVKQDPMQSGSGDQSSHHRFATFSDYNTAIMQRDLEGITNPVTPHTYSGGRVVRDTSFASGYKRWDAIDHAWVGAGTATTDGGIFGLNQNLPVTRGVPVYAIVVTLSNTGTAGATQIYPPLRFTGNLLETIDPTTAAGRASIIPNASTYYWYCRNGGCDFTLRVTYAGGAQRNVLIQGGFRPFNEPAGTPPASASIANNSNSFRTFVVNVPDIGNITNVQLLHTPMVWNGFPASAVVLAAR